MNCAPVKRTTAAVAADICRIVLGATFIFSGLTKLIDPYGTALKTAEYLGAMGLDFAEPLSATLAVAQITLEISLGIVLLTRMFRRLCSLGALVLMIGFTALTLWLAVAEPIDDCGCFGEVVVLTNWQTFYKNLILLALSAIVYRSSRGGKFFVATRRQWIIAVDTVVLTALLTLLNLLFLPVVDTSALKIGTDLRAEVEHNAPSEARVVYRNRATGEKRTFELDDPTWWNDSEWEFVETLIDDAGDRVRVTAADFEIYDNEGNVTDSVVDYEGTTQLICIQNLTSISDRTRRKLSRFAAESLARGERVAVVTASATAESQLPLGDTFVGLFTTDITVMQVLLRAETGVVTLRDGRIVDKRSLSEMK